MQWKLSDTEQTFWAARGVCGDCKVSVEGRAVAFEGFPGAFFIYQEGNYFWVCEVTTGLAVPVGPGPDYIEVLDAAAEALATAGIDKFRSAVARAAQLTEAA